MPPTRPTYHFHHPSRQRLHVQICGSLGDDDCDELMRLTVENLAVHPTVRQVIMDIQQVVDCSATARVGLGSLQKLFARRQLRTAWIAGSASTQGLARLVVMRATDPNAATFMTADQAEVWFSHDIERVATLNKKAGTQS